MALRVGDLFRRNAASAPHRVAASLGEARLSYLELDRAADRLVHALRELSVGPGERVLWWGDTSLDVLPLFAATSKLGAVFAPMNARLGVEEAGELAGLARAAALVADPRRAEAAEAVARSAGVAQLLRLGASGGGGPGVDLTALARGASGAAPVLPELDERDPHAIFFTSGSTGRPKGVVLSHRANWLRSTHGTFCNPEVVVCMFPLFHMAGWTLALSAWQTRGEIAFAEAARASELLDAAEKRRATRLYCIPAVWARVLEAEPSRRDLSSLREVDTGTSATPPELLAALKERFPGTRTRVFYGSTEAGTGARLDDADVLRKPGSVGVAPPGGELRLSDAGEVWLRSDFLMDGYFDDPRATAEALVDGWYRSGDLGSLDAEGYLSIVGRLRDVIRTGGESVAPAEVEAVLCEAPGVAEVAVVGIPDERWGELVCAAVVPAAGAAPSLEALRHHCRGRLARFKQPRRLELLRELPRTAATGQVQRALIVQRILAGGA